MDMSGMTSDNSVTDLPLSDPRCVRGAEACTAFYAAENASQAAVPWIDQFAYGRYLTYYWVVVLFLFSAVHWALRLIEVRQPTQNISGSAAVSPWTKAQGAWRLVAYRRAKGTWLFSVPSTGMAHFLVLSVVFVLALALKEQPYYRQHLGYGSPPLAIRTGLMAFACVPLLVALAGKANAVSFLTGVSHERLNVVHRWVAWVSFGLSLAHALPYFVAGYQDAGWGGFERVQAEFYHDLGPGYEFSGTPALAILFGLCVLSIRPLRTRFYETFFAAHILLATTYLGLLFWHSGDINDSWAYLWAALALWLASWLARALWFTRDVACIRPGAAWLSPSGATLAPLSAQVLKLTVWPANAFHWTPAQHVFVRFVGVAPAQPAHPFTIASAMVPEPENGMGAEMVFYLRVRDGITRRLADYAAAASQKDVDAPAATTVWLDGPYGGVRRPLTRLYDCLLLVAGGSGITACLSWLQEVAMEDWDAAVRTKRVVLVWAVKSLDWVTWLTPALKAASVKGKERGGLQMEIQFFVTGDATSGAAEPDSKHGGPGEESACSKNTTEKKHGESAAPPPRETVGIDGLGSVSHRRPVMRDVLEMHVAASERTIVFGCGPDGFNIDLANATAAAQSRVLRGECVDIALHIERFGW